MRKARRSWRNPLCHLGFGQGTGTSGKLTPRLRNLAKRSLMVEVLEQRQMLSVCPLADEQRVNTYLPGEQRLADSGNPLAARPDGGWVATWASEGQDGSGWGVYTQHFAADGTPLGSEVRANRTTDGDQEHPSVSVAFDGNSIIVWEGAHESRHGGDEEGIVGQRFDATGQRLGREFQINTTLVGRQANPAVAALADGSFMVVWDGKGASDTAGIFGRRYDATGSPLESEFLINTHTARTQERPAVAALPDGGSIVAWQSQEGDDQTEIYAQRFDASGTRVGAEFHVNTTTERVNEHAAIGAGPDGSFVIAWQGGEEDYGIFAQRYNAAGERLGGEFAVNSVSDGDQRDPSVAFNGQGGFAIAWRGSGPGDSAGIFVREYGADGTALAEESLVNSTTESAQRNAALVAAGSGYVLSWSGDGVGDTEGVFLRRLGSGPQTSGISDIQGLEDDPEQVIDLWAAFHDGENSAQQLVYSITANTYPDLFTSTSIDASTGQLMLRYAPNACGLAALTVRATDPGGLYAETTFKVDVDPVEDAPTTLGIETINVSEDAARTVVDLASAFADIDTPSHMLRFELVGNTNPSLFKSAQLFDWSRLLVLDYAPDAFGSAELTVRVTDAGGLFVDATVTVNVAPVNDRPTAAATTTVLARQDAAPTVLDLAGLFTDVDDASASLTYQVLSNDNSGLVTATIDQAQITLAYQAGVTGAAKVVVRGTDAGGLFADHTIDVTVSQTNLAPRIRALADAPDPAIEGATLQLEALGVTDDVRVASVSFWRDANHNGIFEPTVDQRLGTDSDGADGWQLAVSSAGFGSGAQRYFVQATDDEGLASAVVTTMGSVGVEAVLDNAMLSYSESGTGWTSGPAGEGYGGGDRRHAAGTGQNVARWTFDGLVPMEYSVLVTWSAETGLASNASFKIYDGDELLATVAVNQGTEPTDDYAQGTWWHDLGRYAVERGRITVELSDAANGTVVADAVRVVDEAPSIDSLSVTAGPITRPNNVTLTAVNAHAHQGQSVAKVEFYRDANCNAELDAGDQLLGTDTSSTGGWTVMVSSLSFPAGTQTYFAKATDSANETSNVPWATNTVKGPSVYGSPTVNENSTYTLYLDPYGPNGETITQWAINWGDGNTTTVSSAPFTATHVYDGPNTFTISSTANNGAYTCNSISLEVLNIEPYLAISGPATIDEGDAYVLKLSSSDPGNDTILRWQINWGDGNVETIQGNPSVVAHWYANGPGTPTITAKATDEDGTYTVSDTIGGTLDPSFGGSGEVRTNFFETPDVAYQYGRALALQSDGKIIVAGDGSTGCFYLARYNTDGSLDTSFGDDGKLIIDNPAKAVAVQPDDKILVVGTWNNGTNIVGNTDFSLARYDQDGNLDQTFGVGGRVITDFSGGADYATAVAIQTDGTGAVLEKIVVGGFSNGDFAVARYYPNGNLDRNFDSDGRQTTSFGGNDYAYGVAVQSDDKIVVAGTTSVSGDFAILRYNSDGSLDTNFSDDGKQTTNFGGTDYGYAVAIQPSDGKIVVAGAASGNDFALARYNTDGSLDTAPTTDFGGQDAGYAVLVQADGKIVVAGSTSSGNDFAVARYEADYLSLDGNFDSDGKLTTDFGAYEYGYALAQDANSKLLVAGYTSSGTDFAIARYNTGGSLDTSFSTDGKQTTSFESTEYGYATAIQSDGKIVVAGSTSASGDFAVTRYNPDGSLDTTFSDDGKQTVDFGGTDVAYGVAIDPSGGDIILVGSSGNNFAVARLTSAGALDNSFDTDGKQTVDFTGTDVAYAVAIDPTDSDIVVVGSTSVGSDFAVARLTSAGVLDTSFDTDGKQTVNFTGTDVARAVAIDSAHRIVVAGSTSVGSDFAVARLSSGGVLDTNFDTDGLQTVSLSGTDVANAVTIAADGDIVLAGSTSSGGDFAMARLNDAGALDTAFDTDGKQTTNVGGSTDAAYAVAIQTDGKIVAAGYTNLNSNDFALVRYNANGSLDTSFDGASAGDGIVTSNFGGVDVGRGVVLQGTASQPDGRIVVAGYAKNDLAVARYFPGPITQTVSVQNVAPTLTTPSSISVNSGQQFTLSDLGIFTDPGFADGSTTAETFTYSIDWDSDGQVDSGDISNASAVIDAPGGPGILTHGSFDGTCSYTASATATITVRDNDSGEHSHQVSVSICSATVSLGTLSRGTNGQGKDILNATYTIATATSSAPFHIGIYTSADGVTPGTLVSSLPAGDLTNGTRTLSFDADFTLPVEDHYLIAAVIETPSLVSATLPAETVLKTWKGGVYVYGVNNVGQDYDTVTIDGDGLTVNGSQPYDLTGAAFVQVCTYAGDDQVTCATSLPLYAFGGAGADTLEGGSGDDYLDGGADNDTLTSGGGDNRLYGGAGVDSITGGSGTNWLHGGDGGDTITGGSGKNWIYGGDGGDSITGGASVDVIYGGAGNNTLHGGAGPDRLYGGDDGNSLFGDAGDDVLFGGAAADTIQGGEDDDLLVGQAGDDALYGDDNDPYTTWVGNDTSYGGSGTNTYDDDGGADDHVDGDVALPVSIGLYQVEARAGETTETGRWVDSYGGTFDDPFPQPGNAGGGDLGGGGGGGGCGCKTTCPMVTAKGDPNSGNNTTPSAAEGIRNSSLANPHPVVAYNLEITADFAAGEYIRATLDVDDLSANTSVYYKADDLHAGDLVRIADYVDAAGLATGRYHYSFDIDEYRNGTETHRSTEEGHILIINHTESEFGNRWWRDDLDRLVLYVGDGVMLARGDGLAVWFAEDEHGGYVTPAGTESRLVKNQDGSYTIGEADGTQARFSSTGLLTTRFDPAGNRTVYAYQNNEIVSITDPLGRETTFTYTSGLVTSMTDFVGRTYSFAYDNGFLDTLTEPDPDGGTSGPSWIYDYYVNDECPDGLLKTVTNPNGAGITYTYDFAGRLTGELYPNGANRTLTSRESFGLVAAGSEGRGETPNFAYVPSAVLAKDVVATRTYELDDSHTLNTTTYTTDRFGNNTTEGIDRDDGYLLRTLYERDADGRVTKMTQPDPDGPSGPQSSLVTEYEYDSRGNLIETSYPDGTEETWEYDTTWNAVTEHVDAAGRTTTYQIDEDTGSVTSMTQVDSVQGNVTTSYTYTDGTGQYTDLPQGLLLTETDPLGRVTQYDYGTSGNSFGRVTSITYALGTTDEASVSYEYDAAGNVIASTDELGRRTEYEYDALNRLTKTTSPWPDADPDHAQLIDDGGSGFSAAGTGTWTTVSSGGFAGDTATADYQWHDAATGGTAEWAFSGLVVGKQYEILITWVEGGDRATNAAYELTHNSQTTSLGTVNQQVSPANSTGAVQFNNHAFKSLKTFVAAASTATLKLSSNAGGKVVADGVYIVEARPVTSYEYDALGNRSAETDALGNETTYTFCPLGIRQLKTTGADPDGAGSLAAPVTYYGLDKAVRQSDVTDPSGRVTLYDYDQFNRQTKTTAGQVIINGTAAADGDGYTETGTWSDWNSAGFNGHSRTFAAAATETASATWTFENLIPGEEYRILVTWTADETANSTAAPFTVDAGGTPSTVTFDQSAAPGGTQTKTVNLKAFANLGTFTLAEDTTTLTVKLSNETGESPAKRVVADTVLLVRVDPMTETTYDWAGNVATQTEVLDRTDDTIKRTTTYTYDALNRLIRIHQADADGSTSTLGDDPITEYVYDNDGRVKEQHVRGIDGPRVTTYEYDNLGRLTKTTAPWPNSDPADAKLVDDNNTGFSTSGTGSWTQGAGGFDGGDDTHDYRWHDATTGGMAEWAFSGLVVGKQYEILVTWVADGTNNATNAAYELIHNSQTITLDTVDQTVAPENSSGAAQFNNYAFKSLKTFVATASTATLKLYSNAGGRVVADAVYLVEARPVTTTGYDDNSNVAWTKDALGNQTDFTYDNRDRLVTQTDPWPNSDPADAKLVDDGGTGFSTSGTGSWTQETGGFSSDYRWHDATTGGTAEWAFSGLVVGKQYEILVTWVEGTDRATSAAYELTHNSQTTALGTVNQKISPANSAGAVQFDNHTFKSLATFKAAATTATVSLDSNASGKVVADAVYLVEARPETTYVYDDAGQMTEVHAPGPNGARVTTYAYDGLGRTTKVTQPDPDGGGELLAPWTAYAYDGLGRVLTETDRLNGSTAYAYDNLGRLTTKTQRLTAQTNAVTSYTYYASGEMKSLADPEENATTWVYDYLGRMVAETNELGHTRQFQYNAAGDLTRRIDRNGRVIQYVYDRLSRPTEERWYENVDDANQDADRQKTFTFEYNLAGEMTVVEELDAASAVIASYTYGYDELGRVTSIETDLDGLTPVVALTQAYDGLGRRTQLAATIGATADFVSNYQFDNLGRMTQVKQTGQGGNAVAAKRVDFSYDIASQWDTISRYADLAGDDLVASGAYTFDEAGRITGLEYTMPTGSDTAPAYTWTWDAGSRITAFTSKLDATAGQSYGTATYTNDDAGQLTDAVYSNWQNSPGTEDYNYDSNGNRTNNNFTVGQNNQMTAGAGYKYLYDDEGNRTMRFVDPDGNGLDDGDTDITEYVWDHRNRLVEVHHHSTHANYLTNTTDEVITNAYDYQNRWVKKTRDPDGSGGSGAISQRAFIYDGNEMVLQFDKLGAGDIAAADLEHRYLWGASVDQILADETFHDGSVDDVVWPLVDHLNTARDLAKYTGVHTDIPTHRVFDAFGRRTSSASEATTTLIVYTGKPLDGDLDLQYNVYRWYEAATGRWLSEDPIGFKAGDMSLYRYCSGNPTIGVDADGMSLQREPLPALPPISWLPMMPGSNSPVSRPRPKPPTAPDAPRPVIPTRPMMPPVEMRSPCSREGATDTMVARKPAKFTFRVGGVAPCTLSQPRVDCETGKITYIGWQRFTAETTLMVPADTTATVKCMRGKDGNLGWFIIDLTPPAGATMKVACVKTFGPCSAGRIGPTAVA